jgi:hypothetical protein
MLGFKSREAAEAALKEVLTHDDVTRAEVVTVVSLGSTAENPFGEVMAYIVISNQT